MSSIKSYGVNFKEEGRSQVELALEQIRCRGYAVLSDILTPKEVEEARERLDKVYEAQVNEFGAEKLKSINEHDTARAVLAYDEFFLKLASNNTILALVRKILGSYVVLNQQNGILSRPNLNHHQSSWHRDLPYLNYTISRPLSISALFVLDEFSVESGATWLLPCSHLYSEAPSVEFIEQNKVAALAKPGSVLVFDSMLLHGAGYNSGDSTRRAVNHLYTVPILSQQINLPSALSGRFSDDPELRQLLGYDTEVARSVSEWRTRRLSRLGRGEKPKVY